MLTGVIPSEFQYRFESCGSTKRVAVSIKGHHVLAPSILKSRADHSSPDRFETVGMTVVYEGTLNNRRSAVTG